MPEFTPYALARKATLEWQLCKEKAEEALMIVPEEAGPWKDAAVLHCTRIAIYMQYAQQHDWAKAHSHAEALHWSASRIIASL